MRRELTQLRATQLRNRMTEVEWRLWCHLRKRQLRSYKFRRQVPIGPYIADFACLSAALIVELDGGQHEWQQDSDASRQRPIEAAGYRVLRFWNSDVLTGLDGVLETIFEALHRPEMDGRFD